MRPHMEQLLEQVHRCLRLNDQHASTFASRVHRRVSRIHTEGDRAGIAARYIPGGPPHASRTSRPTGALSLKRGPALRLRRAAGARE
jgi:hypothetical protein